ncbi:MAG: 2-hydroxyacyl-CoA dehydratase [Candidatus Cloacimonetes bacterium]|nr:2-hydroxyacyl-CoA dehydratase [Candidatus Cloacimonadota bacterium]
MGKVLSTSSIANSNDNIGFTTSFPVEIVFAAGCRPIDLNNIFIQTYPSILVRKAELASFPRNICAWIKGMYAVINEKSNRGNSTSQKTQINSKLIKSYDSTVNIEMPTLQTIIGIVQGDCSNTHSLMDILKDEGKNIISFSYPFDRDRDFLNTEITKLEAYFNISRSETQKMKQKLDQIRKKLILLDEMTWKTNQITSYENHKWLVSSSDFNSDYEEFSSDLDIFLEKAKIRKPFQKRIRLGYVGVPPILDDLYSFIEDCGARVVFNEVQRQFSMFYLAEDIVEQYRRFTYPYSIFERIEDIKKAIIDRELKGLLCYTQSFCHRQLDVITLKKHLDLPILQIEGDQPNKLDARTKLRIESFIEMISEI